MSQQVTIIGGGMIGLVTAYYLTKENYEVTLIDKSEFGMGCSKGNQGWICPAIHEPVPTPGLISSSIKMMLKKDSPLYINPGKVIQLAPWLWRFMRYCNKKDFFKGEESLLTLSQSTLQLFDDLEKEVNFELHKEGFLFVFLQQKSLNAKFERLLRGAKAYGHDRPIELTKDEVLEREPALSANIIGGIYLKNQYHIRPESLTMGLVAYLKKHNVKLVSGTEITKIEQQKGKITAVCSEKEVFHSDIFLLANGVHSNLLAKQLGYDFPMTAGKGYSMTYNQPAFTFKQPVYLGDDSGGITPFSDALRIGGTMELSGLNTRLDKKRIQGIDLAAKKYFKEELTAGSIDEWVGMRPMTPDGMPIAGKIPGISNGFIATGHGMVGMAMGPITGRIISDMMVKGRTHVNTQSISPERFKK